MGPIVRILRIATSEDRSAKASTYWRTRPLEERLAETLKLHSEGNVLFKGGNPPFVRVMELRHVPVE